MSLRAITPQHQAPDTQIADIYASGYRETSGGVHMLYRIAEMRDWEAAQASGYFASADLTAEGFIHCCTAQQLAAVANRYYQGREALLLLEIDETQVQAPITWEDLTNTGQLFPHVYGHIPLAAVTRCLALKPGSDGRFSSTNIGIF
jgi:uncharacterized protein (DUF952 family)